ncbi:MAG TPA: fumarylacetoacetate hydrolase family protein [Candidatus Limnocylindrales bacterium]
MRLATVLLYGAPVAVTVRGDRFLELQMPGRSNETPTMRGLAALDDAAHRDLAAWVAAQPDVGWRPLTEVDLGPAVPDPGAIYTIGHNYRAADIAAAADTRPERPPVYGKLPSSVAPSGGVVAWDRSLSPNVDAEVELGVVIGDPATDVGVEDAMDHVFGYTLIDDVSSRDAWLDGDQWLLGKSMAGFCPVGPVIVTSDELDPSDLALRCTVNGTLIQDGRTSQMRSSIAEIVSFLSRHVTLRPGDLIATGTPARLEGPVGPDDHLQAGDVVVCAIDGIGELTTTVA